MQYYLIERQLMAGYGIYLIMGFIIMQNPRTFVLYLTEVQSMLVDLSTKSFWFYLTWLIRSLVPLSGFDKEKWPFLQI